MNNAPIPVFLKTIKDMDKYVEDLYPRGKRLRWIDGKYKGRMAEVNWAIWNADDGVFKIKVTVKTERLDGNGFLECNAHYHRLYRQVDQWFESVQK